MKWSHLNIAASSWLTTANETIREKFGFFYKLFSMFVVGLPTRSGTTISSSCLMAICIQLMVRYRHPLHHQHYHPTTSITIPPPALPSHQQHYHPTTSITIPPPALPSHQQNNAGRERKQKTGVSESGCSWVCPCQLQGSNKQDGCDQNENHTALCDYWLK